MPITRHIMPDRRFLLTTLVGEVDDSMLHQHLECMQQDQLRITDLRELTDCRNMQHVDNLSVKSLSMEAMSQVKRMESYLAILIDDNPLHYGLARVCQTLSVDLKKEVQIFHDQEEALTWLAHDEQDLTALRNFVNQYT